MATILARHKVESIIHLAGCKRVDESVGRSLHHHAQNIGGLLAVLSAMDAADVRRIVFSSSAAMYGDAGGVVDERATLSPVNPYGRTKLAGKCLLADVARASTLRAVSLRYFNVAGAG